MSAEILTSGCRLNAFESEVIRGHTQHLTNTLVFNTCAVTGQAERDARQAIARAHRERPDMAIVVTGCAAQIDPARWAALPGVTRVLGNQEKLSAASWAEGAGNACADIMQARDAAAPVVTTTTSRARAFLAVQQGCDHRCTFCIIPFGRGPNRSVPVALIAEQLRALTQAGHAEIVLTGVDLTSYGADLAESGRPRLGHMLRQVLAAVPELPRLRLSSLDPAAIDDDLWALIEGEPRLMPHLHLSLQSSSDLILKRMKRRHNRADAAAVINRARAVRPGIAIGADLISGFPTETDALFEETLGFVRDHAIPYLHVFPYSERPGTPAARMPAVPPAIRRARAALLRAQGASNAAQFHAAQVGTPAQIVVERAGEAYAAGHTQHFAPVRLAGQWPHASLLHARITGANADHLLAEAA
jgi:threonylcarbamoyladenosine tRNA methylthiotransferase MtaB